MRYLSILIFATITLGCTAQKSKLLIEQTLISDLSKEPFYLKLVKEGTSTWKKKYQYLDSIQMYDITYLSNGLKIKGYIVKPKFPGNYPCIIYNRGGSRDFGKLNIARVVTLLGKIAKEGYVVIASQYRGNGGSEGKEEFGGADINDVIALTNVLQEVSNTDTGKIGMYGWSRGGMMTYIALTKTNKIKAAVVGGAPSDSFEMIKDRPEMGTKVLAELIPNYETEKEQELIKRSAIRWVDKFPKDVPILVLHGNADWRVKPQQSLNMALAFEEQRIPYRLIIYEGGDHGISEHRNEVNAQIISWFDKYLKKNIPIPNMEYHGR